MQQRKEIKDLRDELAKQQDENKFLAGELESLRATVSRLAATREAMKVEAPNYLTPKFACNGTNLDAGTIRKWCGDGLIDCTKPGGRWYVDLAGERTKTRLALYRPKMEGFLK
jgi:hypothetical protein